MSYASCVKSTSTKKSSTPPAEKNNFSRHDTTTTSTTTPSLFYLPENLTFDKFCTTLHNFVEQKSNALASAVCSGPAGNGTITAVTDYIASTYSEKKHQLAAISSYLNSYFPDDEKNKSRKARSGSKKLLTRRQKRNLKRYLRRQQRRKDKEDTTLSSDTATSENNADEEEDTKMVKRNKMKNAVAKGEGGTKANKRNQQRKKGKMKSGGEGNNQTGGGGASPKMGNKKKTKRGGRKFNKNRRGSKERGGNNNDKNGNQQGSAANRPARPKKVQWAPVAAKFVKFRNYALLTKCKQYVEEALESLKDNGIFIENTARLQATSDDEEEEEEEESGEDDWDSDVEDDAHKDLKAMLDDGEEGEEDEDEDDDEDMSDEDDEDDQDNDSHMQDEDDYSRSGGEQDQSSHHDEPPFQPAPVPGLTGTATGTRTTLRPLKPLVPLAKANAVGGALAKATSSVIANLTKQLPPQGGPKYNLTKPTGPAVAAPNTGGVSWTTKSAAEIYKEKMRNNSNKLINPPVDERTQEIHTKIKLSYSHYYFQNVAKRQNLPAYQKQCHFLVAVSKADVVVLCAETGSGKTTQLPQLLMEFWAKESQYQANEKTKALAAGLEKSKEDDYYRSPPGRIRKIICTQPRRISATSVAERVAWERGENIGEKIGYQVRFDRMISREKTELIYCTVGILLKQLESDPLLPEYDAIIVDEVHERGVATDFLLLILRDVLKVRATTPIDIGDGEKKLIPLKLILMSATIDANAMADYFEKGVSELVAKEQEKEKEKKEKNKDKDKDKDAAIKDKNVATAAAAASTTDSNNKLDGFQLKTALCEMPGATVYPIEEKYLNDLLPDIAPEFGIKGVNKDPTYKPYKFKTPMGKEFQNMKQRMMQGERQWMYTGDFEVSRFDAEMIARIVEYIHYVLEEKQKDEPGAIMIFVPGWREICDVCTLLQNTVFQNRDEYLILRLHSTVEKREQSRVFDLPEKGVRKIIVATNIAETSITVSDIVHVIDSGWHRAVAYNPSTNSSGLETLFVAKSNVRQRRGRAGRCRPGKFFAAYTKKQYDHFELQEKPEMLRTPVESLVLQLKAMNPNLGIGRNESVAKILQRAIAPPERKAVENAIQLLEALGAIRRIEMKDQPKDEEIQAAADKLAAITNPTVAGTAASTTGAAAAGALVLKPNPNSLQLAAANAATKPKLTPLMSAVAAQKQLQASQQVLLAAGRFAGKGIQTTVMAAANMKGGMKPGGMMMNNMANKMVGAAGAMTRTVNNQIMVQNGKGQMVPALAGGAANGKNAGQLAELLEKEQEKIREKMEEIKENAIPRKEYYEVLTPLGRQLSQVPLHPTLARLFLLGDLFSKALNLPKLYEQITIVACGITQKSPFCRVRQDMEHQAIAMREKKAENTFSDHVLLAKIYKDYMRKNGITFDNMQDPYDNWDNWDGWGSNYNSQRNNRGMMGSFVSADDEFLDQVTLENNTKQFEELNTRMQTGYMKTFTVVKSLGDSGVQEILDRCKMEASSRNNSEVVKYQMEQIAEMNKQLMMTNQMALAGVMGTKLPTAVKESAAAAAAAAAEITKAQMLTNAAAASAGNKGSSFGGKGGGKNNPNAMPLGGSKGSASGNNQATSSSGGLKALKPMSASLNDLKAGDWLKNQIEEKQRQMRLKSGCLDIVDCSHETNMTRALLTACFPIAASANPTNCDNCKFVRCLVDDVRCEPDRNSVVNNLCSNALKPQQSKQVQQQKGRNLAVADPTLKGLAIGKNFNPDAGIASYLVAYFERSSNAVSTDTKATQTARDCTLVYDPMPLILLNPLLDLKKCEHYQSKNNEFILPCVTKLKKIPTRGAIPAPVGPLHVAIGGNKNAGATSGQQQGPLGGQTAADLEKKAQEYNPVIYELSAHKTKGMDEEKKQHVTRLYLEFCNEMIGDTVFELRAMVIQLIELMLAGNQNLLESVHKEQKKKRDNRERDRVAAARERADRDDRDRRREDNNSYRGRRNSTDRDRRGRDRNYSPRRNSPRNSHRDTRDHADRYSPRNSRRNDSREKPPVRGPPPRRDDSRRRAPPTKMDTEEPRGRQNTNYSRFNDSFNHEGNHHADVPSDKEDSRGPPALPEGGTAGALSKGTGSRSNRNDSRNRNQSAPAGNPRRNDSRGGRRNNDSRRRGPRGRRDSRGRGRGDSRARRVLAPLRRGAGARKESRSRERSRDREFIDPAVFDEKNQPSQKRDQSMNNSSGSAAAGVTTQQLQKKDHTSPEAVVEKKEERKFFWDDARAEEPVQQRRNPLFAKSSEAPALPNGPRQDYNLQQDQQWNQQQWGGPGGRDNNEISRDCLWKCSRAITAIAEILLEGAKLYEISVPDMHKVMHESGAAKMATVGK
ncbi:unnamed protein product [Amoebophrya sp. A120]|nr:unnamed protein product [Amoebophrya sp. A120]|eukprot:GSA120T00008523001.1